MNFLCWLHSYQQCGSPLKNLIPHPRCELKIMPFFVGEVGEKWLNETPRSQVKIHLCHIAAHLLLIHYKRSRHLQGHPNWDYACDLEANHLLQSLSFTTFAKIKPTKKKWAGLSAEEIFIKMLKSENEGRRFGDSHDFWKDLTLSSRIAVSQSIASRMLTPEQLNKVLGQYQQILGDKLPFLPPEVVAGHEAGSTTEHISVPITRNLRFKLKNVLDAVLIKRRGFSRPEYDFLFMWQRKYAEVSLPLYPRQIVIGIDTSGSISGHGLRACAAIARFIVTSLFSIYPSTEVHVALVDAELQRSWSSVAATEYLDDFLAEMKGRGGTKIFKSIQKFIDMENLSPDAVIIISDFDTTDTDNDLQTDAPILGIILNEYRDCAKALEEKQKTYKKVKFVVSLSLEEVIEHG
jgi:predicted metal-dependent peptidase